MGWPGRSALRSSERCAWADTHRSTSSAPATHGSIGRQSGQRRDMGRSAGTCLHVHGETNASWAVASDTVVDREGRHQGRGHGTFHMDGGSQCRCHRPGAHIAPSATHRSGRGHPAVVPPVRAGQEQKPGHGTAPQPAPRPSTANLRWWARWTCPEAQSAAEPEGYELFMHDARENGVQRRGGISQRRHANGSRCIPPRIPARPPSTRGRLLQGHRS